MDYCGLPSDPGLLRANGTSWLSKHRLYSPARQKVVGT